MEIPVFSMLTIMLSSIYLNLSLPVAVHAYLPGLGFPPAFISAIATQASQMNKGEIIRRKKNYLSDQAM